MSNRASLVRTEFKCLKTGESTFGFRLYDDYDQFYMDGDETRQAIPEDDLKFWEYAIQNAGCAERALLESLLKNKKGLCIDGVWYDFTELKRALRRALDRPVVRQQDECRSGA